MQTPTPESRLYNESAYWLEILAIASLSVAGASALLIVFDIIAGHPQHMWVMNIVWPVTALYFGPLALHAYFRWGRLSTHHAAQHAKDKGQQNPGKKKPFWQTVSVGATHCGSGCTLGDIIAEWLLFAFPVVLFGHKIFGSWAVDYGLAFLLGIAFQYFTIAPMRGLSFKDGLVAALKADTLSLTAWQVGMYGWMAIATFLIFGQEIPKSHPVFWFMMPVAMWLVSPPAIPSIGGCSDATSKKPCSLATGISKDARASSPRTLPIATTATSRHA